MVEKVVGRWFWVHKIVFTGRLPPPRPPAVPGGLPAAQTPWRGACSPPCPPAYREAPPLGLSVDLGTKIFGGTSLVRWRDPPGGRGPSKIVLVKTNAENGVANHSL